MKLERLFIENFKNYTGEHTFDLGRDLTIIVGKNGFGKSTFFDAIEWCITGNLNRFNKKEFDPKEDVLNFHNIGTDKTCRVQLFFNGNKLERSFRYVDNKVGNMKVSLTKKEGTIVTGQGNIDQFIKNTYFRENRDKSEFFGDLIKHSHLLSQDQVSDFIVKDNPKQRFNSIAEILGLKHILYVFENLNEIKKVIERKIKDLNIQKDTIKTSLKEQRNTLEKIDVNKVNCNLKILGIKGKFKDSFGKLELHKESLEKAIYNAKLHIEGYHGLKNLNYATVDEFKQHLNILENNLKNIESKILGAEKLKERLGTLRNTLEKQTNELDELNQLNIKIKTIKISQGYEDYTDLTIEGLRNLLSNEESLLQVIKFSLSNQKKFNEMKSFCKNYNVHIDKIEKEYVFLLRRERRLHRLLEKLEEKVNNENNTIKVKLVDHLKGILEYVVEEGEQQKISKCPVCSSDKGHQLPLLIQDNIEQSIQTLNKDKKIAEKYSRTKKIITKKLEDVEEKIYRIQNEKENLFRKYETYRARLKNIMEDRLFNSHYFEDHSENQLDSILNTHEGKIGSLKKAVNLKIEFEQLMNKKDLLKKITGTSNGSTKNIERRISNLDRAKNRIIKYIKSNEEQFIEEENKYKNLTRKLNNIEEKDEYDDIISEIDVLNGRIIQMERKLELTSGLLDMKYTLNLNKKIGKDIRKYFVKRQELIEEKNKLELIVQSIIDYKGSMQNVIGNQTTSFLNDKNSLIQKYFRYLNPLSNNTEIHFEAESGELNVYIPIKTEDETQKYYKAKHTLSSGQLNVLAIAIFLAVNESQKVSKFDFIGIDDPIQNMDDVNRYSICDVLSRLKKQVIISTHDMEFVKLLLKKNDHNLKNIQVYLLENPIFEEKRVQHITF